MIRLCAQRFSRAHRSPSWPWPPSAREADLTPKPGLVDQRGSGAHTDMDLAMLHASAESLRNAFAECASAARQSAPGPELRDRLGEIGRAGERAMLEATGGVNTHRGALWALGLLSAGAALGGGPAGAVDVAARLAAIPDRHITATTSHGAQARLRYGVSRRNRRGAGRVPARPPVRTARAARRQTLRRRRRDGTPGGTVVTDGHSRRHLRAASRRTRRVCARCRRARRPWSTRAESVHLRARRHFTALDEMCRTQAAIARRQWRSVVGHGVSRHPGREGCQPCRP